MIGNGQPVAQPAAPPIAPLTIPPQPEWKKKYPTVLSGILSFLQFGISVVIIGCEVGSVLIDMYNATIYVGLWAGLFFFIAWISLSGSACCCQSRGCATYTLIIQIIALFFAACVIGFDAYYITHPTTCFFPTSTCNSGSLRGLFYSDSNFENIKLSLIKGQLAAGSVMFVLCLLYVVIYIVTLFLIRRAKTPQSIYPQAPYQLPMVPTGPDGMITAPPAVNVRPPRMGSPLYHRPTIVLDNGEGRTNDLLCPTCSTMMNVTVKKRPPQ